MDPSTEEIRLRDRHDLDAVPGPDRLIGARQHRTLEDFHQLPTAARDAVRRGMPPAEGEDPPRRGGPWRKAR